MVKDITQKLLFIITLLLFCLSRQINLAIQAGFMLTELLFHLAFKMQGL